MQFLCSKHVMTRHVVLSRAVDFMLLVKLHPFFSFELQLNKMQISVSLIYQTPETLPCAE